MGDLVRQTQLELRIRRAKEQGGGSAVDEMALKEAKERGKYEIENAKRERLKVKFSRLLKYDLASQRYKVINKVLDKRIERASLSRNLAENKLNHLLADKNVRFAKKHEKKYDEIL